MRLRWREGKPENGNMRKWLTNQYEAFPNLLICPAMYGFGPHLKPHEKPITNSHELLFVNFKGSDQVFLTCFLAQIWPADFLFQILMKHISTLEREKTFWDRTPATKSACRLYAVLSIFLGVSKWTTPEVFSPYKMWEIANAFIISLTCLISNTGVRCLDPASLLYLVCFVSRCFLFLSGCRLMTPVSFSRRQIQCQTCSDFAAYSFRIVLLKKNIRSF